MAYLKSPISAYGARVKSPEFKGAVSWLNVSKPISIEELRGKIVLLDFWTFCCINCMHVIPDLKKLEQKYGHKLTVIGVHSAKFENEKDSENIRQAVLRYEIEHPVINDANFAIWNAFGARGWPTFILIDPEGYIVEQISGEGQFNYLDEEISKLLKTFEGKISEKEIPLVLEKNKETPKQLSFPGKVLVDEKSNRIFISDSNHNQIIITNLSGEIIEKIGSGKIGKNDGAFNVATFFHPQGSVLREDILYVADTENHLIREMDLKNKKVTTILGTGEQSQDRVGGKSGNAQGLNSPWDLVIVGDTLYIAMAGPHQIWQMDLNSHVAKVFAGSGHENIVDGPAARAALAQPSGLTTDGKRLFFADSEVSAVRYVTLDNEKRVGTIIGHGLFDFGDRDGDLKNALLQHPLGVSFADGKLYVADTYNHKVKEIDLEKNTIRTIAGSGKADLALFSEPGGIYTSNGKAFVADTNNHAIKVVDLKSGDVKSLDIRSKNNEKSAGEFSKALGPNAEIINLPEISLKKDSELKLEMQIKFEDGYHLNKKAPSFLSMYVEGEDSQLAHGIVKENPFILLIPKTSKGDSIKLVADTTLYYCEVSGKGLCKIKSFRFVQPVKFSNNSNDTKITLKADLAK